MESYHGIKNATLEQFTPSEILFHDGVINTTAYGDDCAQNEPPVIGLGNHSFIEECIYFIIYLSWCLFREEAFCWLS